jgi:anti-sigma-K factor RskA
MSSRDDQWWDLQAAEYVLGVLSDQDRAVFERLLQSDARARQAVADWERRLDPLHLTTQPVTPPAGVYAQIIELIERDEHSASSRIGASIVTELKEQVRFWQTAMVAGVATTVAIAAALFMLLGKPLTDQDTPAAQVAQVSTVSVIEDDSGQPIWALTYRAPKTETGNSEAATGIASPTDKNNPRGNGEIILTAVGQWPLDTDNSHQLWMVLADGSGVQSVGLLPNELGQSVVVPLPIPLSDSTDFAVSLEAFGGTNEPTPQGPVLSSATVVLPAGVI